MISLYGDALREIARLVDVAAELDGEVIGEELAARQDGREPWEDGGEDPSHELKGSAFQLGAAAMQVARTGSADQVARAKQILDEARKKIYGILAEA